MHRSRLVVRACCPKVRTLRLISDTDDIKCGCHLVIASSPNFRALANVIKAEEATTLQMLLPVRHSVVKGEFVS